MIRPGLVTAGVTGGSSSADDGVDLPSGGTGIDWVDYSDAAAGIRVDLAADRP